MDRKLAEEVRLPFTDDKIYKEVMKMGINDREAIYNHMVASLIYNQHLVTQVTHKGVREQLEQTILRQKRELRNY